jgi:hypothetical protein
MPGYRLAVELLTFYLCDLQLSMGMRLLFCSIGRRWTIFLLLWSTLGTKPNRTGRPLQTNHDLGMVVDLEHTHEHISTHWIWNRVWLRGRMLCHSQQYVNVAWIVCRKWLIERLTVVYCGGWGNIGRNVAMWWHFRWSPLRPWLSKISPAIKRTEPLI